LSKTAARAPNLFLPLYYITIAIRYQVFSAIFSSFCAFNVQLVNVSRETRLPKGVPTFQSHVFAQAMFHVKLPKTQSLPTRRRNSEHGKPKTRKHNDRFT